MTDRTAVAHEALEALEYRTSHSEYSQAAPRTSLDAWLRRIGPLPPYSAVLGQCTDGLPMLVDLSDPEHGAILVVGDEGLEALPRALLVSAAYLNHPDQVSFTVITPDHDFDDLARLPACDSVISSYDRRSSEAVIELAAVAEQRKSGRERGPVHVLCIHDLRALLSYDEYDLLAYLSWLVEFGARLGVVPLATVRLGDIAPIQEQAPRLLPLFATRVAAALPAYQASVRGGEAISFQPMVV